MKKLLPILLLLFGFLLLPGYGQEKKAANLPKNFRKTVDQLWTSLASDSGSSKGQTCKAATEGFTGVNSATRSKQATPIPNNVTHPVAH